MTALEAPPAVAVSSSPAPASGTIRFLGYERAYWQLLIRGAVLLLLTLGIYRFWLATEMRRFLWGNTAIAGDTLEYTGTATELLLGFLFAIAILVPLYALFFLAALDMGLLGQLSGVVGFVLLALLGQFAIYRARRYRLSRTAYRGVRCYQTGSAWAYAFYALLWWTAILLSLGLAYPWAQASLERFKMRHTFYGDLQGRFEGSGLSLFLRGCLLWLLVVGPFFVGMAAAIGAIDWSALAEAVSEGGSGLAARIESSNPGYATAIVLAVVAVSWAALAAAVFFPAFQALMLRWWSCGVCFGDLSVTSNLRARQVYRAYVRFLLYGVLFAVAIALIGWAGFAAAYYLGAVAESSEADEITAGLLIMLGYVLVALGYSTIYQATVKLSLWRLGMESAELAGIEILDHVKAAGRPSSAVGEGLADALHVGGI
jgi:uncharacterized membrane protein YjgN (DUF898 family)